jgi:hypothetical protein
VLGHAIGDLVNTGLALAVYASIRRELAGSTTHHRTDDFEDPAWRWDEGDQLPDGRRVGWEWLGRIRAALDREGLEAYGG